MRFQNRWSQETDKWVVEIMANRTALTCIRYRNVPVSLFVLSMTPLSALATLLDAQSVPHACMEQEVATCTSEVWYLQETSLRWSLGYWKSLKHQTKCHTFHQCQSPWHHLLCLNHFWGQWQHLSSLSVLLSVHRSPSHFQPL